MWSARTAVAGGRCCHRKREAACLTGYLFLIVIPVILSSCSTVDRFADHSIEYNIQAEKIKNQNLLNNIIRSAYRKPLQFTDLSTITGQVSLSGAGMFTVPFGDPRSGFIFSPNITVSDTPNFTVSVLNTQEFYQGVLRPLDPEIIAYYLTQAFPPNVFLTLAILEITDDTKIFYNTPAGYGEFAMELEHLLSQGLTVQKLENFTVLGPLLSAKDIKKMDIAKLDAQNIKITRNGNNYHLEKTENSYQFCFLPVVGYPTDTCTKKEQSINTPGPDSRRRPGTYVINRENRKISIVVRSIEGVIYYLGEWARQQLIYPETNVVDLPKITDRLGGTDVLFQLRYGAGQDHAISTSYEGEDYHIGVDPSGRDRSSQALELTLELLALNTSAKELPAPSILPVIPR